MEEQNASEVKRCTSCNRLKPTSEFYWRRGNPRSQCRACILEGFKKAYAENAEERKAHTRAYRASRIAEDRHFLRRCHLRHKYGISLEDYEYLFKKQEGKCATCGEVAAGGSPSRILVVDHCHESGRVRGLLCARCNKLLGVAGDDLVGATKMAALFQRFIAYLRCADPFAQSLETLQQRRKLATKKKPKIKQ